MFTTPTLTLCGCGWRGGIGVDGGGSEMTSRAKRKGGIR